MSDVVSLAWLGLGWASVCLLHLAAALVERRRNMDGQQQEKPKAVVPDFNGNGVPDWQEGWFWGSLWRVTAALVKTFSGPNSRERALVEAGERFESEMRGGGGR